MLDYYLTLMSNLVLIYDNMIKKKSGINNNSEYRLFLTNNADKIIEFNQLESLEWFDIRENELSDLPKGFENLKNLKTLILWENKFETIPSSVYKMKGLETIFIKWGNNISEQDISELQKALPNTKIK